MKKLLLSAIILSLLTGCGPSQKEFDDLIKENNVLKKQIEDKNNEILKLKETPEELLASAKKHQEIGRQITALKELINRFPQSGEAKAANELLKDIYSNMANLESDAQASFALAEYCNITGERVPFGFKGADIPKILDIYRDKEVTKNEYETKSEYDKRFKQSIENIGYGQQCIELKTYLTYDADSQAWDVSLHDESNYGSDSLDLITNKNTRSADSYTATNAFGAQANVEKKETLNQGVRLKSSDFFKLLSSIIVVVNPNKYSKQISFPFPIEKAKLVDGRDIKFIAQYKWVPNYVTTFENRKTPTFSSPREVIDEYQLINGDILKIIIYNKKTGEIYKIAEKVAKK
ncbi:MULTISPECIES: hypothetical protein [Providencia]|uniref:hypothetical protein n=1 Tax=Providencia TaxID=586 RepID=UPI00234A5504|nr:MULTISPECIES: hypothetical protein [Providencia]MDK7745203.1 hypothetical protein [Providencia rettgeri]MDK7757715.1 hypothetical protein [Providencia rettgeri]